MLIGTPLTVYGKGTQTRGIINIRDTLRCVELASLNPAAPGEFRVFNQATEQFSLMQLAELVARVARTKGYKPEIAHIRNPRKEMEDHYYNVKHQALERLGLVPHLLTDEVIGEMIDSVASLRAKIIPAAVMPDISWQSGRTRKAASPERARAVVA